MQTMISFEEARAIILSNLPAPVVVQVPLENALHRTLAEPVFCPADSPPFDQSAMDGYAIRYSPGLENTELNISGRIPAGKISSLRMGKHEAVRIFTGAPLPPGADTVVMQEKVELSGGVIKILDSGLSKGANVRKKGSHVREGRSVMDKGSKITAGAIGLLASLGISRVMVYRHPSVSVIVTGDELIRPGRKLKDGCIYESNSFALIAALRSSGLDSEIHSFRSKDDESDLRNTITKALRKSEILIITGGVSVGELDLVKPVLEKIKSRIIFHKVKQKPGKPFLFASKGGKLIFGLPGNPASVLSCFYAYVATALDRITGSHGVLERELPSEEIIQARPGLTLLLKARVQDGKVHLLSDQESYKLNSFATANALAVIRPGRHVEKKGNPVIVLQFLPSF